MAGFRNKLYAYGGAALLAAASALSPLWAQTCNSAISATTPDSDFTLNGDGTATHHRTGLTWLRCSLGQSWDGTTCTGTASAYTWQAALQAPVGYSFAGLGDWRLPNKNELASLVERSCYEPAMNLTVFPDMASLYVWSSSPLAGSSDYAWSVYFLYGDVGFDNRSSSEQVRLVRGGQ